MDGNIDMKTNNEDPKVILKHYLDRLRNLKETYNPHQICNIGVNLRDYIPKLDLSYRQSGLFVNDVQYLINIASNVGDYQVLTHTSEIRESDKDVLKKAIDEVIFQIDSIINYPVSIKLKSIPIKKEKKFFDFFRNYKDKNKVIATDNNRITNKHHDVFICHASEDKDTVARPFAEKLTKGGIVVWYDEFSLRWGSKLMKKITEGIQASKIGIVILSPNFFEKKWPQLELDALVELLNVDDGELLPLRYNLTPEDIKKNLPLLAGILSRSWDDGVDDLILEVKNILKEKDTNRTVKPVKTERIFKADPTQYDITLDKFTENGNHCVGIRNAKGKTFKSCQILCDVKKCIWWDTHEDDPRHIYEGGGGNVMLPHGFANTNPVITVMSENNKIEQLRLSQIVRRPSAKWLAEDENEIKVENLNTAISRIRSNLGTLWSLNQIFLDYPKGFPISDEIRQNLSLKNEIVENTQTVTNQSSYMLVMDWMNDINDLCNLAKNNPWMFEGKVQALQCERCAGIINQLKSILEKLPNPPI